MLRSSRPFHIILDFDKTITDRDTIQILGQISHEHRSQRKSGHSSSQQSEVREQQWTECIEAYQKDYDAQIASYTPKATERVSINAEIEYHRSFREIENRSVERISAGRFFKDISPQAWRESARKKLHQGSLEVRKGLKEFIDRVERRGERGKWGVVSVNWSVAWIKGVLEEALGSFKEVNRPDILSNDVFSETGVIVGANISSTDLNHRRRILTCEDKRIAMDFLLEKWRSTVRELETPLRIYIGDSLTDIECLIGVDVGIIISEDGSGSLISTLRRLGCSIEHIASYKASEERTLWWARDFEEIGACSLIP